MASAAYGKLKKRLWDSHDISLTTKLAVFRAVILLTLLYSMETMTLYRRHFNKLIFTHTPYIGSTTVSLHVAQLVRALHQNRRAAGLDSRQRADTVIFRNSS